MWLEMLITNAEVYQVGLYDLRIDGGIIVEMGRLQPLHGEPVVDAAGGALLPGLTDHHIHFLSYAASLSSIDCSPSKVANGIQLAELLRQTPGDTWLRGFGYHESVAGDIDRHWIDQCCDHRPVRIQHRTGRLWIYNSAAIEQLKLAMEQQNSNHPLTTSSLESGRFYDADQSLGDLLGRHLPPVAEASRRLAAFGITAFSDMTPSNDQETFSLFKRLRQQNNLLQHVQLARNKPFTQTNPTDSVMPGPVKIHLHESRLPALQDLVDRITLSHEHGVAVAIHAVTEIEMLFSITALEDAGTIQGDRIEHASVTPDYLLEKIKALDLTVVTQPQFIFGKGDTYRQDVAADSLPHLYRCAAFVNSGIALAGSSDAPFGCPDPWSSMRAAVTRRTSSGQVLTGDEVLSPEQALALYLGGLHSPGKLRQLEVGATADLCLLDRPWLSARRTLHSDHVKLVFNQGTPVYQKQDCISLQYQKAQPTL